MMETPPNTPIANNNRMMKSEADADKGAQLASLPVLIAATKDSSNVRQNFARFQISADEEDDVL